MTFTANLGSNDDGQGRNEGEVEGGEEAEDDKEKEEEKEEEDEEGKGEEIGIGCKSLFQGDKKLILAFFSLPFLADGPVSDRYLVYNFFFSQKKKDIV